MSNETSASTLSGPLRVSGKEFRLGETGPPCFIRAVTFGPFPAGVFPGGEIRTELERVKEELGANAVRFFEPPPIHWLNDCADLGLLAFITISWSQHVDFLNQHHIRRETEIRIKDIVTRYRGQPAVAGYFVGNEIETTLVRYLGPKRVVRFIERLIDIGRDHDPNVLFSYANYPSTEFLIPENQDFLAFNVYLEDRETLASYLDRLQSLSGNCPVLLSEFGADSKALSVETQSEILNWHIDEVCRAGLAGTTVFAWSDQWSRGGETITDWNFGLTDYDGTSKQSLHTLADKWQNIETAFDGVALSQIPKFSIVICTYKGAKLVKGAVESALSLNYPNYEIIVVNDGNDDRVREIIQPIDSVRHVGVPHGGLSNARNIGAKTATGDIIAYTDDDCILPPEWLNWLALAFESPDRPDCVGGPNIPPPALTKEQACVIASPGGPSHVLIGNRLAEHVPGCNIAVKKHVFDDIGGFDDRFWTAGDDVDFCWRLMDAGYKIGFHGAAFVWHLRRSTYKAYLRQQKGYGRAEAILKGVHPEKFGNLGGAVWHGFVYEGPPLSYSRSSESIYHGKYGYEAFQLIYPDHNNGLATVFTHVAFVLPQIFFLLLGLINPWLLLIPGAGLLLTFSIVLKSAFHADLQREFDSLWARLTLFSLILKQGFQRSAERIVRSGVFTNPIGFGIGVIGAIRSLKTPRPGNSLVLNFWNENGIGRSELIDALTAYHFDIDETGKADFETKKGLFFDTELTTVTEFHEKSHRLTRARISFALKWKRFVVGLIAILLIGDYFSNPWWLPVAFLAVPATEWVITAIRQSSAIASAARKAGLELMKE
ncbi:MAG: glycosyltransferase [Verrucomicrobiales bacterium]|nr:glycosyltransferase [Verrucomicrobiales bacterium]